MLLNGEKIGLHAYPIGAIYMSTNATSPAELFGGSWLPLTADAYFKIVTTNAGVTGGQSDHKIPIASMPSHKHDLDYGMIGQSQLGNINAGANVYAGYQIIYKTKNTGGDNAYYPHYYGVYAWVRIDPEEIE